MGIKRIDVMIGAIIAGAFIFFAEFGENPIKEEIVVYASPSGVCELTAPDLGYQKTYKPEIKNLNSEFWRSKYGSAVRALCYQKITKEAEKYYGLPSNWLLGLSIAETEAIEFRGNETSTAEGLCHMLDGTAKDFGLEVSSQSYLEQLKDSYGESPMALANNDCRLHHIKNFDAAARMLACWTNNPPLTIQTTKFSGYTAFEKAMYQWRGSSESKHEFKTFYNKVGNWAKFFNNEEKVLQLEERFNDAHQNLLIDGEKADYDKYLEVMQLKINTSYELNKYRTWLKEKSQKNLPNTEAFGETLQREQFIVPFFYFFQSLIKIPPRTRETMTFCFSFQPKLNIISLGIVTTKELPPNFVTLRTFLFTSFCVAIC